MSAKNDFQITVTDETHFENFEQHWDESLSAALNVINEKVTGDAEVRAPVGVTNEFKGGIQPLLERPSPLVLIGYVFSTADHAAIIEGVDEEGNETKYGRQPNTAFPNISALTIWVEKVLHPPEENLEDTVINVGRAIVTRGLPRPGYQHFRPIGNALKQNKPWIEETLDKAIDEALGKI